jgi:hypothetical protein
VLEKTEDMTKVAPRWTPEGKRKRGRPKTTWRRTIENEIRERGYTCGTIERKAKRNLYKPFLVNNSISCHTIIYFLILK